MESERAAEPRAETWRPGVGLARGIQQLCVSIPGIDEHIWWVARRPTALPPRQQTYDSSWRTLAWCHWIKMHQRCSVDLPAWRLALSLFASSLMFLFAAYCSLSIDESLFVPAWSVVQTIHL